MQKPGLVELTVEVPHPLGALICRLAQWQDDTAFWQELAQACGYTATLLNAQPVPVATETPRIAKEMRDVTDLAWTLAAGETE